MAVNLANGIAQAHTQHTHAAVSQKQPPIKLSEPLADDSARSSSQENDGTRVLASAECPRFV